MWWLLRVLLRGLLRCGSDAAKGLLRCCLGGLGGLGGLCRLCRNSEVVPH